MSEEKYIQLSELEQWIRQEVNIWGDNYDMHQLMSDIEDGYIKTYTAREAWNNEAARNKDS